jgi:hypothetical protein
MVCLAAVVPLEHVDNPASVKDILVEARRTHEGFDDAAEARIMSSQGCKVHKSSLLEPWFEFRMDAPEDLTRNAGAGRPHVAAKIR